MNVPTLILGIDVLQKSHSIRKAWPNSISYVKYMSVLVVTHIKHVRCLCHFSTIPFAEGWYDVVQMRFTPIILRSSLRKQDSNCFHWSVVMISGALKREIQCT